MLVDAFSKRIFNLAYQFTGDFAEAEDLTQEIFFKLHSSLEKYDFKKDFQAWFLTLARNHLIDRYRKTKREKSSRDEYDEHFLAADPGTGPENSIMARENRRIIWEGLQVLSPDIRLSVILRDIQGKSYQEIAEIMSLPLGTVKSRVNRGRLQLAKVLQEKTEVPRGM